MPAHLKPPELRQRRNIPAEAADLTAPDPDSKIPDLPNPDKREWHELTKSWWEDVWRSPMSTRYLKADAHALVMVALLIDDFWKAGSAKERRELAAEIRQNTARFGLSNWDRNRMNWSITAKPEEKPKPQSAANNGKDPRGILHRVP